MASVFLYSENSFAPEIENFCEFIFICNNTVKFVAIQLPNMRLDT